MTETDSELAGMIEVAQRAGEQVAAAFAAHRDKRLTVDHKQGGEPVTRADREANALICAELERRFAGYGIVAEESAPAPEATAARQRVFHVDPIDGTREFIGGIGEFAVMIGLAVEGRAVAGVLHLPAENRLLAGRIGAGAFAIDAGGFRRELSVSGRERFDEATLVVSRARTPKLAEPLRRRLGVGRVLPCGSVGVKIARIVSQHADLYVHFGPGLKTWDSCAPEAVLTAAGGRLSDLQGQPIDYRAAVLSLAGGVVASNGLLHPGTLSAVGWAHREAERLTAGG